MNKEQIIKDAFAETKISEGDCPKSFLDKVTLKIIEKAIQKERERIIYIFKKRKDSGIGCYTCGSYKYLMAPKSFWNSPAEPFCLKCLISKGVEK